MLIPRCFAGFEIIIFEKDPSASEFFATTIQSWKDVLTYPGLELEICPSGVVEVGSITVKLSDNCRGVLL